MKATLGTHPGMRTLGRTGLVVSPIGLGLAALGRPGYINVGHGDDLAERDPASLERRCHEVLDAAWEAGIRYFDAARSYGRAEAFLASWLEHSQSRRLVVGSKWGYHYTADWQVTADKHEVKDHSLEAFQRQREETRALLPGLVLYQIHSLTPDSPALSDRALWRALATLRQEGVHIGISLSGPAQAHVLGKALEVRVDGVALFETVQATWNLYERSAGSALAEAASAGWGVIIKEALANGRLVRGHTSPAVRTLAEHTGVGVDALAMAAVLAQPFCHVVLSGAATVTQLRSNLRALAIDGTGIAESLPGVVESPEQYWTTRSHLIWS